MSTLQELQLRYTDLINKNAKLAKNRRRYSKDLITDVLQYLEQGGDKAALAQWLNISHKSLINLIRHKASPPEVPSQASMFLKVQSKAINDSEITITYPSGLVLRLPMKI